MAAMIGYSSVSVFDTFQTRLLEAKAARKRCLTARLCRADFASLMTQVILLQAGPNPKFSVMGVELSIDDSLQGGEMDFADTDPEVTYEKGLNGVIEFSKRERSKVEVPANPVAPIVLEPAKPRSVREALYGDKFALIDQLVRVAHADAGTAIEAANKAVAHAKTLRSHALRELAEAEKVGINFGHCLLDLPDLDCEVSK